MKFWYEYTKEELEELPDKLPQQIVDGYKGKPPYVWDDELKLWVDVSLSVL